MRQSTRETHRHHHAPIGGAGWVYLHAALGAGERAVQQLRPHFRGARHGTTDGGQTTDALRLQVANSVSRTSKGFGGNGQRIMSSIFFVGQF